MRVGLYGGSFDPIHAGHVEPIRVARRELGLDRVIYLPTASPPHKPAREFAAAHHRYTMVELALLEDFDLVVSAFELTPGRSAFTVETIRHFRATQPDDELILILGADSLARLDTYREWEEIVASARVGVLARPDWDLERVLPGLAPKLADRVGSDAVVAVSNPPVEASATRLREILAMGGAPPAGWMDERVLQYVRKYRLYR